MKFFISVAAVASLVSGIYGLTVNTLTTSSLVVCEPISLTWSDGTAPYYLTIIPGGDTSSAALETFDSTSDTSVTWTVDIAAGTSITLAIKDSTGTIAYSDAVSIQTGSDTSCVSSATAGSYAGSAATSAADTVAASSGAAASTANASTAAVSTAAVSTAAGSAAVSTTKAAATSATSAKASTVSASSSTPSSGASRATVINYGLGGFLGLFGVVLL
ncbi:hypothetical protein C8R44DRAFT_890885 [Mycena epipterygia]|nr:hypothetical protein C8R44DRAFT_890885 [Mycena epipterygia]